MIESNRDSYGTWYVLLLSIACWVTCPFELVTGKWIMCRLVKIELEQLGIYFKLKKTNHDLPIYFVSTFLKNWPKRDHDLIQNSMVQFRLWDLSDLEGFLLSLYIQNIFGLIIWILAHQENWRNYFILLFVSLLVWRAKTFIRK